MATSRFITPNDNADLPFAFTSIRAATSGDVRLLVVARGELTLRVTAGVTYYVPFRRVFATGTTATGLTASVISPGRTLPATTTPGPTTTPAPTTTPEPTTTPAPEGFAWFDGTPVQFSDGTVLNSES